MADRPVADKPVRPHGNGKRFSTITDLCEYLDTLETPGADGPAFVLHSYRNELLRADKQAKSWRKGYYLVRVTVLLAAASITVISGISVPSGGVLALRVTVLVLGAVITVITGFLDLFHMLARWRNHRVMRYRLLAGGLSAASAEKDNAITELGKQLVAALHEFEDNYISQIATEGPPPKEPHTGSDGAAPPK